VFSVFIWPITTAFFVFFPKRVANGIRFYRVLLPDRSRFYHLRCVWRQYHNFSRLFVDRFLLHENGELSYTSEGWENIKAAVAARSGGILLMSHMGNWEMAAGLLTQKTPGLRLLLYMGRKHKEKIGAFIKSGLSRTGIRIVAVDPEGGSALEIIEGIHFLREGGLISLTGDRPWSGKERTVPVRFLGHEAHVLEAPHVIALLSGAPIFIFFAFRSGPRQYHFFITEPIYVRAAGRADRQAVIRQSAQRYADHMEQMLRRHPLQWFNFGAFLGRKLPNDGNLYGEPPSGDLGYGQK
jgi:lauroyl/myristoyl acyltransferase